jgi:hypothetical protein
VGAAKVGTAYTFGLGVFAGALIVLGASFAAAVTAGGARLPRVSRGCLRVSRFRSA